MKIREAVLALVLPLSLASQEKIRFGIQAGMAFPIGELANLADVGPRVSFTMQDNVDSRTIFRAQLEYSTLNSKLKDIHSANFQIFNLDLDSLFYFTDIEGALYGIIGMGIYRTQFGPDNTRTRPGGSVGLGYSFSRKISVEIKYTGIVSRNTKTEMFLASLVYCF